jgi:hypothetical protein
MWDGFQPNEFEWGKWTVLVVGYFEEIILEQ